MSLIRWFVSCFIGFFVLIGQKLKLLDQKIEDKISDKIWYPMKMTLALVIVGASLLCWVPHSHKTAIQLVRYPGTDLYVRYMPEKVAGFIKRHYPKTDKRLIIYTEFMVSDPNPPCSKEFIAAFNRLKNDPEYRKSYLIVPLKTQFQSVSYYEGDGEDEALADLEKSIDGLNEFSDLCDLAVCIVDPDNRWIFNWDRMNDSESARRMREILDLFGQ